MELKAIVHSPRHKWGVAYEVIIDDEIKKVAPKSIIQIIAAIRTMEKENILPKGFTDSGRVPYYGEFRPSDLADIPLDSISRRLWNVPPEATLKDVMNCYSYFYYTLYLYWLLKENICSEMRWPSRDIKGYIGGVEESCGCCSRITMPSDHSLDSIPTTTVEDRDGDKQHICSLCLSNYFYCCNECDEDSQRTLHRDESIHFNEDDVTLCRACYEDCGGSCANCGEAGYTEDMVLLNDSYYCRSCAEEMPPDTLHEYDYRPYWHFYGEKHGPFYGLELETDDYNDRSCACEDLLDNDNKEANYYLKEDGSLTQGIEIAFHPRTIKSWLDYAGELKEVIRIVKHWGGTSYDAGTCGAHVHRSNGDLGPVATTKLITAFIRLQYYLEKIAQRHHNNYCTFALLEQEGGQGCKLVYKKVVNGMLKQNRGAINISNDQTVEYRIYKGSLALDTLLAYLIFTDKFTAWCKRVPIMGLYKKPSEQLWDAFKASLAEGKESKLLLKYITEKEAN